MLETLCEIEVKKMMQQYVKIFTCILASIFLLLPYQVLGCTIFHIVDKNGNVLVGRNFDSEGEGGKIWFIPSNDKYNGMAILEQLGPNMPYEGINDKGLFVGISAVPKTRTPFSFIKPIRKSLEMVKLILARAQTVDEALGLFSKYTVAFGVFLGNPVVHYMIVDKEGNSAIVEYVDNKIVVIKDTFNSRIMTNHFISKPEVESDNKTSFERYNTVKNNIGKIHTVEDVQNLLKQVCQNTTLWSNIYDLNRQLIYVSYKDSPTVIFNLKDELYKGRHGYALNCLPGKKSLKYIENKVRVILRPHFGYGYMGRERISHYGIRLLLPAGSTKRYGVEFTKFNKFFMMAGIVLEQRLFEWFNMSIGTVGYFNYKSDQNNNVVGLVSNLGWEPDNHIPFKPFVTYRSDVILEKPVKSISSIVVGFNFEF